MCLQSPAVLSPHDYHPPPESVVEEGDQSVLYLERDVSSLVLYSPALSGVEGREHGLLVLLLIKATAQHLKPYRYFIGLTARIALTAVMFACTCRVGTSSMAAVSLTGEHKVQRLSYVEGELC